MSTTTIGCYAWRIYRDRCLDDIIEHTSVGSDFCCTTDIERGSWIGRIETKRESSSLPEVAAIHTVADVELIVSTRIGCIGIVSDQYII